MQDFFGSRRDDDAVRFRVYAPDHRRVDVVLYKKDGRQQLGSFAMTATERGFFEASFDGPQRLLYKYVVDGAGPFPDPASRSQPFGVHGPSEVIDERHVWRDSGWNGIAVENLIIYETHVGAATSAGTFDGLIARLPDLRELGITAVELMPVASFPGRHNWGYDGVSLFAPHAGYGGPSGLRRFVDAAHRAGLAVLLDVVYNHLGPDGNYLGVYAREFFTARHHTPWGDAIDFARPVVRSFFLENVAMWIRDYHLDGLRLDATHAIFDESEPHFLREVGQHARAAAPSRRVLVIAEDDRNERRLVAPPNRGGYQLDALWADDFHHSLHRALTGESDGYYGDFSGGAEELATILREGWLYQGQHSAHHRALRGTRPAGIEPARFVYCLQNHDQVGNRAFGERLGHLVSPAQNRAASALLVVAPATPLLFMGQEWNASTPFLYFTDHEEKLGHAVSEGRRAEFAGFAHFSTTNARGAIPDPQSPDTFARSVLRWEERLEPARAGILRLYQELLRLRSTHPALQVMRRDPVEVTALGEHALVLRRRAPNADLVAVFNLRGELRHAPVGALRLLLSTENPRFGGTRRDEDVWVKGEVRLEGPGAVLLETSR